MSLIGKRIVITRPEALASDFVQMLCEVGAIPVIFPTIAIEAIPNNEALDTALADLGAYDWLVFTSANGVRFTLDRMQTLGLQLSALKTRQIAAIGPATAARLQESDVIISLYPEQYVAESLFEGLRTYGPLVGEKFLLLRAELARGDLPALLRASGADVTDIPVYRTVMGQPAPADFDALRAGVDVITFTSSSTVRNFMTLLDYDATAIANKALIACIGPITAQTAREAGLNVGLIAEEYTIPALVSALSERSTP